jgi:predicted ATPase/class 3 adenylate cyclase
MTQTLPGGILTFLFTDIESSTQLWEQLPEAMKGALQRHDAILRQAVEGDGGVIVKNTGDGCLAVFRTAPEAVAGALAAQRALAADPWPEIAPRAVCVRMALVTGEAELRAGDYYGPAVNRAARLMAAGYGGQVLLSGITAALAGQQLPPEASLHDLGSHRLKDLSSPEHVYQLLAPGLQAEFPALKSLDATPSNLPAQLTSFVGRRRELAEATQRLASTRLLTVVGPGGTGKTRLTVQLGADVLGQFPDGAWLVELAPVSDPELVLQSLAAVLNLRERPGITLLDLVVSFLEVKRLLLILDNCEHLIEACAWLADTLLRHCPQLKIIASSREALGISGEAIYPLPSLVLPLASGDSPWRSWAARAVTADELEAIRQSEAVQLFVERAVAVQSHFKLGEQNAAAVAQICRRLDGIPLAIELAAVRVRLLAPEQIASRLDDRFRLLTGGSRTALPRQQTLQALIDWSYDLLSPEEQGLFRRLSVFTGGWFIEAAEAVCPGFEVLDLMAQLINKSLVAVEESTDGTMRYRMLETIRQYGLERILETGEMAEARDRHLEYYLQVAEDREQDYYSPREIQTLNAFELEHDNFRAALQWGLEGNYVALLRLAGSLATFWTRRGYNLEGYNWLKMGLDLIPSIHPLSGEQKNKLQLVRAKAMLGSASTLFGQGQFSRVVTASAEAEGLYRDAGEPSGMAMAMGLQGLAAIQSGDHDLARTELQKAINFGRQIGNKIALSLSLTAYGFLLLIVEGNFIAAKQCYLESIQYSNDIGSAWITAQASLGLGRLAEFDSQPEQFRQHFLEAEALYQEMGDRYFVNVARSERAHIERRQGNLEVAETLYRGCLPEWMELGQKAAISHELECLAYIAVTKERPTRAAKLLGAAQALRETTGVNMQPIERTEYEGEIAKLKIGLDTDSLEAAWSAGRKMDPAQAMACALDEMGCS